MMKAVCVLLFFFIPAFADDIVVTTGMDAVENGENLQDALDAAGCGDTVILQAGSTYQGPDVADQAFLLPYKPECTGDDFITIRTSNLAGLSADGVRIDPASHAVAMPKLVANIATFGMPVVAVELLSNHYKLIGLEITNQGANYAPEMVRIRPDGGSGPGGNATYAELIETSYFIIDRCFVHAPEISAEDLFPSTLGRTTSRGIRVEGVNISVINSYVAGFAGWDITLSSPHDSYGIYTVIGPGPIHIVNNYIEAQFNNIFLGGGDNHTLNTATVSDPTLTSATLSNVDNLTVGDLVAFSSAATTPTPWETGEITAIDGNSVSFTLIQGFYNGPMIAPDDSGTARWNGINVGNVEIRGNFLNKPDAWNAFSAPKAFIEIKDCVDCIIDGNRMYSGVPAPIAYTPRNQAGSAPWARVENIVFSNNEITGYSTALVLQGSDNEWPSVPSGNWTFRNNLWISPQPAAVFVLLGQGFFNGRDISISHNTILNTGPAMQLPSVTEGQFLLKDNIFVSGVYGLNCFLGTLLTCLPGLEMIDNVIIGPPIMDAPYCTDQGGVVYPPGNNCVDDADDVGFEDHANDNYRLAAMSPYKNAASDGKDIGVDYDELLAAINGGSPAPRSRMRLFRR